MAEFEPTENLSERDIWDLRDTIETAQDERPIQAFLSSRPYILTSLLSGHYRYCIPQKRLGSEFVPDFVLGAVDSLGAHWTVIELESPRSGIYTKKGDKLDAKASKGLSQVQDWRNWLAENLAYARGKRSDSGLSLFDIRPKPLGLVVVGRRHLMPPCTDAQRREHRESAQIEIHTYDWLLDQLNGSFKYIGPPGANPYVLAAT